MSALSRCERQLVLLSAGVASRRREINAEQLVEKVDWTRLAETLRARRLLPALGPRLLELAQGAAGDGFAVSVKEATTTARHHAAFLQLASLRVTGALAESEIRCTPLKGPWLAEALYGDPGRRLSSDIDLLVAPERLEDAVKVVRGLGYEAPEDHVDETGLPKLHFRLVHEARKLPPVELHWRVHYYERSFARERLLPPAPGPAGAWRPALADELAAMLLFYARDGFVDLRLAVDLSAWWDAHGEELPCRALQGPIAAYPELARAITAALEVADRVVGLPSRRALGSKAPLGPRGRTAARLANPNPRASRSQLYADIGLVDGLLAPPGGFRAFVRRQVLIPREALADLDRRAPKRRARSLPGRGVGILCRYALSMTRVALAPGRTLR